VNCPIDGRVEEGGARIGAEGGEGRFAGAGATKHSLEVEGRKEDSDSSRGNQH
jgi:hypothetical protein